MSDPGMIYTVYGTNGPIVDITGHQIQFFLFFQGIGENGRQAHPVPGLFQLTPSTPPGVAQIALYVTPIKDITSVLNTLWDAYQAQIITNVKTVASQLGGKNVVVRKPSIPASGRVRAEATSGPGTQLLILDYWVPGLSFPVDVGGSKVSASFQVTVDVEVLIIVYAQEWPAMQLKAIPSLHNAKIKITGGGNYLQEGLLELLNAISGSTSNLANQINNEIIPAPDLSQLAAGIGQLEQVAVSVGLKQCRVSVDPNSKVLSITLVHPMDPAPFAYNPATYQSFSRPILGTTQYQAVPGGQLGVTGTSFPATGEVAVAWYPSSSGAVQESFVNWGPEGQNPSQATVPGSTTQFAQSGLQQGETYDFQVSNFDGLQSTPYSNWVSIQALGLINLVLSYQSNAPPPTPLKGRRGSPAPQPATRPATKVIATVPANPGIFSISVHIPPDAVPGLATLCAVSGGQQLACVQIAMVTEVQPQIYAWNPSSGTVGSATILAGQTIYIHGEGFTYDDLIDLFIDQATNGPPQVSTTVAVDGTFTVPLPWPPPQAGFGNINAPGNHTIIAVEVRPFQTNVQASLPVLLQAPLG
jgi:hypothetical protein